MAPLYCVQRRDARRHCVAPAHHESGAERLNIISGAVLLSQSIATIVMLSQYVAWLKVSRALDHYRVLPISLALLMIALTTVYGLFAWPGIFLIAAEGFWLDHLSLHFSLMLIPLLLFTSVAMGSLGSLIGLMAPDEGLAGLFGNLVMMGVLFLWCPSIPWDNGRWRFGFFPRRDPWILKGIMFHGPFNAWPHWLGLALYAAVAMTWSAYVIKKPQ